jgi:dTDP-4-amino-4,6-dideoxygalactose transaminase
MARIYLSPPTITAADHAALGAALESGWVAPVGPQLDAFERELAALAGTSGALAVTSGTAALHLALLGVGVQQGDTVLVPTMTFAATAFPLQYIGARPWFVDAHPEPAADAWRAALAAARAAGRRVTAVIAVDLYGGCGNLEALSALCVDEGLTLIEDAAEAVGARWNARPCGGFGRCAIYSFNGNKIVTTSGGGALLSNDEALLARARHRANQAREPQLWYEHQETGYNYRMSNVLAALGRSQLARLAHKIQRRQAIRAAYAQALESVPGLALIPYPTQCQPNYWLTTITVDPAACGGLTALDVVQRLGQLDIEARPLWKPLHVQPVFAGWGGPACPRAEHLFATGLCLPSGDGLTDLQQAQVIAALLRSVQPTGY